MPLLDEHLVHISADTTFRKPRVMYPKSVLDNIFM